MSNKRASLESFSLAFSFHTEVIRRVFPPDSGTQSTLKNTTFTAVPTLHSANNVVRATGVLFGLEETLSEIKNLSIC